MNRRDVAAERRCADCGTQKLPQMSSPFTGGLFRCGRCHLREIERRELEIYQPWRLRQTLPVERVGQPATPEKGR